MIRRNLLAVCAFSILLTASAAFAHGGQEHLMGTVKTIDEKSITVTTKDKKDVTVPLGPSTKFEKAGAVATAGDVSVGDRVVVHSKKGDSGMVAVLVKVGSTAPSKHPHAGK